MKAPRVEDFDPKATPALGSPMDNLPRIEKPSVSAGTKPIDSSIATPSIRNNVDQPQHSDRNLASQNARLPESQKGRMEESQIARKPESQKSGVLAAVLPYLDLRNSGKTSFRYPPALIERLADAQYEAKKRYGKKLTFNNVAVAALAWFLWDFEQQGKDSALYQILLGKEK